VHTSWLIFATMTGFESVASAASFGISALLVVMRALRVLKIREELVDCLQRLVEDKLLPIAASMAVDGLQKPTAFRRLLDKSAHHLGTSLAGKSHYEQNGAACYQTIAHKAELYFGISTESLQILITEANAYTSENSDVLKLAYSRSADPEFQSFLEQEQSVFAEELQVQHVEQFGRLEAYFEDAKAGWSRRIDNVRSFCVQQLGPLCSGSTIEKEVETI